MIDTCIMATTLDRVRRSIAKQQGDVVLRKDLLHLGSSARVDASLGELVNAGRLWRIGRGVYAKTIKIQGKTVPRAGLWSMVPEALEKLGVEFDYHPAITAYTLGLSDQVPLNLVVIPRGRISRKMSVGGSTLEYVSNKQLRSAENPSSKR